MASKLVQPYTRESSESHAGLRRPSTQPGHFLRASFTGFDKPLAIFLRNSKKGTFYKKSNFLQRMPFSSKVPKNKRSLETQGSNFFCLSVLAIAGSAILANICVACDGYLQEVPDQTQACFVISFAASLCSFGRRARTENLPVPSQKLKAPSADGGIANSLSFSLARKFSAKFNNGQQIGSTIHSWVVRKSRRLKETKHPARPLFASQLHRIWQAIGNLPPKFKKRYFL